MDGRTDGRSSSQSIESVSQKINWKVIGADLLKRNGTNERL